MTCTVCAIGTHEGCGWYTALVGLACCCGHIRHHVGCVGADYHEGECEVWEAEPEPEHDTDCVGWLDHDGPCITLADVEEERLHARDYEKWAAL